MSSSSFESSEWYDSSSDETERRIRVIRERHELNSALSRELLANAEGQTRVKDVDGILYIIHHLPSAYSFYYSIHIQSDVILEYRRCLVFN